MLKNILITSSTGLVGHAFKNSNEFNRAIFINGRKDVDLTDKDSVFKFFDRLDNQYKLPEIIINVAAKVGGIKANTEQMDDFFVQNIEIGKNILCAAQKYQIPTVYSFLSTCVYPEKVDGSFKENQIHNGPPPKSNLGYAYAKRATEIHSSILKEKGFNYNCVIPNNLYGENDLFDLNNCHVIPSMIRKIFEAKINNKPSVMFWGDGMALREFTFASDIPKILNFLIQKDNTESILNIGTSGEQRIIDVANKIKEIIGYNGIICWEGTKTLAGQFRKPSDNSKLLSLGWKESDFTSFDIGIRQTCDWFMKNYPNIRL